MNLSLSEEESDSDGEITTRRPYVAKRPRLESDTDSQRDGTLPPPRSVKHPSCGVDTNPAYHVPGTPDELTDLPTAITSGPPLHCSSRSKLKTNGIQKSFKRHLPRESISRESPQATAAGDVTSNDSDTGSSKMVSIKLTDALLSSRKYSLRKVLGMVDRQQRETVAKQPQQSFDSNGGDGVTTTTLDDEAGNLRQIFGMVDKKQTISKQSHKSLPLDDKVPPKGISPDTVSSDSNEETLSASEGESGERCGMVETKSHQYAGRDICLSKAKPKNTGRLGNKRKGAGFGRARTNKRRRATYRMRGAVVSTETSDSETDGGRGGTAGGAPVRRSKRTTKGKSLRHLQDSSDTEYSPTPAKKHKTEPGARDPPPFCTKARKSPLHGNILADILTDVPEVDICSLSSQISKRSQEGTEKRKDPPSGPQRPRSLHLPTDATSMATQTSTLPSGRRVELNIEQKTSLSGQNKRLTALLVKKSFSHHKVRSVDTKGTEATTMDIGKPVKKKSQGTHSRVLMSWEKDMTLGSKATRAPVLYALEKIPDKIAEVEGPWMEKAKLIWTYWKKVLPSERDKYTERAKQNRLLEKETATRKRIKSKERNQSKIDGTQAPPSSITTKEEPFTSESDIQQHNSTDLRTQPFSGGIQPHNHSSTDLRMQPFSGGIQPHNHSSTDLRTQPFSGGIQPHNHSSTDLRTQPFSGGIQPHNHSSTDLRTQPFTSSIQPHNHIGTGLATVQSTLNAPKVSPKQSSKPPGGTISHAPLITHVITPSWFYSGNAGPTSSSAQTPPNYKGVRVQDGGVVVSPTSPFAQRISLQTNMVSCELSLKEGGTKTEDLCSAVDREIETLEETLAGSPTTPPCSPSLQHRSKPFNSPDKQAHDYPQLPSPPLSTTTSTGSPQSALREGDSSRQSSIKSTPQTSKKGSTSTPQTSKKGSASSPQTSKKGSVSSPKKRSAHSSIKGGSTSPKVQSPAEVVYGATSIGSNVLPTPSQITNFCTNLGPAIPLQGAPFSPVAGGSPFTFLVYPPSFPPSITDGHSTGKPSSDLLVSAVNHSTITSLPVTSESVMTSRAPKGSTLQPQNAKKSKRSKAKSTPPHKSSAQHMKGGTEKEGVSSPTKIDPKKPSAPGDTSNERTVPKKDGVKGVSHNPLSPNTIRYHAQTHTPEQKGSRSYGHVDRLSILSAIRAKIYSQIPAEFATNVPPITSSSLPTANFESPPNVTFQPSQSRSSPETSVAPPISATADIFAVESNPLYELLNVPPVTTKRTRPTSMPAAKPPKSISTKLQRREISPLTAATASGLRTNTIPQPTSMSGDKKTETGVALTAQSTPVLSSVTNSNVMPVLPFGSVDLSSFLSRNASSAPVALPFQRFLPYPQASQQPLMFAANGEMQHFLEGSVFATPTPLPIAPTLVNAKPAYTQIQMPTCQIPRYPSDDSPSQNSSRANVPCTSTGHQKQDPIVSTQATGHQKQDPIVSTQATGHQKQDPIVSMQATGHQKQDPIVSTQATGHQKQDPIVSMQATGHQKQDPIVSMQATGHQKQDPIVSMQATGHQKQDPIVSTQATGHQKQDPIVSTQATGHQKQDPIVSMQAQTQTGTSISSPHTSSSHQHASPSILASTLHCKTERSGASAQAQVATSVGFSELSASLGSSTSATFGSQYQGTNPNSVCAPTTEKSLVHDSTAPQQTHAILQSPAALPSLPSTSAKPQPCPIGLSLPPTSIPLTFTCSSSATTHQSNSPSIVTASLSSANSKMDVLKKVQELNLGGTKPSIAKVENAEGNPETTLNKDAPAKKPRKRSNKVPSSSLVPLVAQSPVEQLPTTENTYTLTSPQAFVVSPAESYQEVFKQEIFSSQVATTPVGGEASEDLVTIDQPVLHINPPFGDVSLNQREIERLYIQNMAVLEQQRRYTKMLEQKLIKMEEECNKQTKKPDKMDVYKSFLGFVVEPTCEGCIPIKIPGYSAQASEEVEFSNGRSEKPVLKSDFDIYASFVP